MWLIFWFMGVVCHNLSLSFYTWDNTDQSHKARSWLWARPVCSVAVLCLLGSHTVWFEVASRWISVRQTDQLKTYDVHHQKTDLKVFVVVIPKEGLVDWGPANPSLGMTPTIILSCAREAGSPLKAIARVRTRPPVPFSPVKGGLFLATKGASNLLG